MEDLALVALGCLFHDLGKVVQRANPNPMTKSHPIFGADFLNSLGISTQYKEWSAVVECVKFHHWKQIKSGDFDSRLAWFAYEADNLASAHDRKTAPELFDAEGNRIDECEMQDKNKWNSKIRLNSVFSSFEGARKGNQENTSFQIWFRRIKDGKYLREQYPFPEAPEQLKGDTIENYQVLRDKVLAPLVEFIKNKPPTELATVNECLSYLEETLSMVPPDTYTGRTNDVSLYDHLRLTAAIGACMYSYAKETHPDWLCKETKTIPWPRTFRDEPAYILVKADISGIQSFIYNISSKAALKGLRGRSFYLELLQQQLADELLAGMDLSRANLLYLGGGGFAILAPNTSSARGLIGLMRERFNDWLLSKFGGKLYLALEFAELSGNQLRGGDEVKTSSMAEAWRQVGSKLAIAKQEKFKNNLKAYFSIGHSGGEECKICHRSDTKVRTRELYDDESLSLCNVCGDLIQIGKSLPDAGYNLGKQSYELFIEQPGEEEGLLPTWNNKNEKFESSSIRILSSKGAKDGWVLHNFDPYRPPKVFWSLRESTNNDFKALAKEASRQTGSGVERVGILRADVDNLGKVFAGTDSKIGLASRLRSISRDALVSRSLSRFFTHYLDNMLSESASSDGEDWAITTVYAGGDDIFLVGAWNQIIDFALLLEEKFNHYTCNALTISAGIAIHKPSHPLYRMADDAAIAETAAKHSGKNRLCIGFDDSIGSTSQKHCFEWRTWRETIHPLYREIMQLSEEQSVSSSFWNYLLTYSRARDRSYYKLLYNIARMEERQQRLKDADLWQHFKRNWLLKLEGRAASDSASRQLETALNWFLLAQRDPNLAKGRNVMATAENR